VNTLTVLITGNANRDFPAIIEAARMYPKAKALKCERIRVEKVNGARVAEFPLAAVEKFVQTYRLIPQPDRALRRDRGDYEIRTPVYPGWRKESI
jgi:hypothetical protein